MIEELIDLKVGRKERGGVKVLEGISCARKLGAVLERAKLFLALRSCCL
jgi:hypothetical protein